MCCDVESDIWICVGYDFCVDGRLISDCVEGIEWGDWNFCCEVDVVVVFNLGFCRIVILKGIVDWDVNVV